MLWFFGLDLGLEALRTTPGWSWFWSCRMVLLTSVHSLMNSPNLVKHVEVDGLLSLLQVRQLITGLIHLLLDERVVRLDVQQSFVVIDC